MLDVAVPVHVPPDLTAPGPRYRRMVVAVTVAVLGFVGLYLGLVALAADTLRVAMGILLGGGDDDRVVMAVLALPPAALLLGLLGSGLLVFRGRRDEDPLRVELTRAEDPELLAFVDHVADQARAPRPHRVFVTADVNAAVTFDDHLLALVLPARKNLVIGLGLVNTLTLDELKAVLAHEFGHFSQSSMRLGAWVQVASAVAARLVTVRSPLDDLVRSWSGLDPRIAWLGWLVAGMFWSVRRVLADLYWVVRAPERALSREMELHADKVAVSVTGSDSLIHALARLPFAERTLTDAIEVARARGARGEWVRDVFALHTTTMASERQRAPDEGAVPARPEPPTGAHRVFGDEVAPPPRMWASHPPGQDREASAKSPYLPSQLDARPAWVAFDRGDALRVALTARLNEALGMKPGAVAVASSADEPYRHPRYLGLHDCGLSASASVGDAEALIAAAPADDDDLDAGLAALYGPATAELVSGRQRRLADLQLLFEILAGHRELPEDTLTFRGAEVPAADLPVVAERVRAELLADGEAILARVREVRSLHREAARRLGPHWVLAHRDAMRLEHRLEHEAHDLAAIGGALQALLQTVRDRALDPGQEQALLKKLAGERILFGRLLERLDAVACAPEVLPPGVASLRALVHPEPLIGAPDLVMWKPEWFQELWGQLARAELGLHDARGLALSWLLGVEDTIAAARRGEAVQAPPSAALVPDRKLNPEDPLAWLRGLELPTPQRPALDARARHVGGSLAAACLLAALLLFRGFLGASDLIVLNATGSEVLARVGHHDLRMAPRSRAFVRLWWAGETRLGAALPDGTVLDDEVADVIGGRGVYNIGRRGVLAETEVLYGATNQEPRSSLVGNPLYLPTEAWYVLEDPPRSIETDQALVRRSMLVDAGDVDDAQLLEVLGATDPAGAAAFARTLLLADEPSEVTPLAASWLAASEPEEARSLVERLVQRSPGSVHAHRARQDASPRGSLVAEYARLATERDDADHHYLHGRLLPSAEAVGAYDRALALDPGHPLARCARALAYDELARWAEAEAAYAACVASSPERVHELLPSRLVVARMLGAVGVDERISAVLDEAGDDPAATMLRAALEAEVDREPRYAGRVTGEDAAAVHLAAGDPAGALAALPPPDQRTASAWLFALFAALSDGADPSLLPEVLDAATSPGRADLDAWYAAAAVRASHPSAAERLRALRARGPEGALLADLVERPRAPDELEAALLGQRPEIRAVAWPLTATLRPDPDARARARRLSLPGMRPSWH